MKSTKLSSHSTKNEICNVKTWWKTSVPDSSLIMWHLALPSFSDSLWLGSNLGLNKTQITLACIGLDVPPISPPCGRGVIFGPRRFFKSPVFWWQSCLFLKGACGSSRPAVVSLLNYRGSDYRAQVCFVVTFHRSDCAPVSRNAYSWGKQKKSSGITANRSELALRCEKRHIESWKWLRGLCHFQSSKSKRVNSLYETGEKKKMFIVPLQALLV